MINNDIDTIKRLAAPIVEEAGLFLVDVEIKHQKVPELWVLADSEHGGVDLNSCSKISRKLGLELENHSSFEGKYKLNVSSPGLSRPLSDRRQFPKNIGRKARVKFTKEDTYQTVEGVIHEVTESIITVETPDGKLTQIPFSSMAETKILPIF